MASLLSTPDLFTKSCHLEFSVLFEQEGPHFHSALSPSNYVAIPDKGSFLLRLDPRLPLDPKTLWVLLCFQLLPIIIYMFKPLPSAHNQRFLHTASYFFLFLFLIPQPVLERSLLCPHFLPAHPLLGPLPAEAACPSAMKLLSLTQSPRPALFQSTSFCSTSLFLILEPLPLLVLLLLPACSCSGPFPRVSSPALPLTLGCHRDHPGHSPPPPNTLHGQSHLFL